MNGRVAVRIGDRQIDANGFGGRRINSGFADGASEIGIRLLAEDLKRLDAQHRRLHDGEGGAALVADGISGLRGSAAGADETPSDGFITFAKLVVRRCGCGKAEDCVFACVACGECEGEIFVLEIPDSGQRIIVDRRTAAIACDMDSHLIVIFHPSDIDHNGLRSALPHGIVGGGELHLHRRLHIRNG